MRVICAGEMLVDIFVRPVQQIPFENDTQIVPDIRITSGGDANNNAINFAKLGHQVAYLGRLGCDEMGDYVASLAQAAGIDISHTVRSSTARQTKSVILVNPKGDRTFLQDPGTSAEFCLTTVICLCWTGQKCFRLGALFICRSLTARAPPNC